MVLLAIVLVLIGMQVSFAAFVEDGHNNTRSRYSLKSLDHSSYNFSLSSLNHTRGMGLNVFPGFNTLKENNPQSDEVEINSPMRVHRGNTVYIFNFKYKVRSNNPLPLFRAPSAPFLR